MGDETEVKLVKYQSRGIHEGPGGESAEVFVMLCPHCHKPTNYQVFMVGGGGGGTLTKATPCSICGATEGIYQEKDGVRYCQRCREVKP